jgi:DNA-binding LacI/PurR family transcriptional regulator
MLPDPAMAWGREMADGYYAWCAEKGVEPQRLLGWFDTTMDEVRDALDALLAGEGRPDAVITAPEGVAIVALESIRAAGLEPGRDVLIASYVDSDSLAVTQPSITALDLRPREMGRRCMELLVRALEGGEREDVEIPISIIERGSTADGVPTA